MQDAELYGQGFAGSLGIPSLSYMGEAGAGATVTLIVENSSGVDNAAGYLFVGTSEVSIPTRGGGEIVCSNDVAFDRIRLEPGLNTISLTLPTDLDVDKVCVQVLQQDSGSKGGYAMTRGMKISLD